MTSILGDHVTFRNLRITSFGQIMIKETWTADVLLGEESLLFSGPWEWLSESFRQVLYL